VAERANFRLEIKKKMLETFTNLDDRPDALIPVDVTAKVHVDIVLDEQRLQPLHHGRGDAISSGRWTNANTKEMQN
jgi:hypothetical protein